jgi:hypothetical protein
MDIKEYMERDWVMADFLRLIMGRKDWYWRITEGSGVKLGCPVRYIDITEGSMAMMGCSVGYINVTEDSRAKLGCPVGYMDITEGFGPSWSALWGT